MLIRWLLAALHLLALGLGLGAVWARSRALRGTLDAEGLRRVFYADNFWGMAAVLWLVTGPIRAFAGLEKGTTYYLHNDLFLTKMALLVVLLALEAWPMSVLIRWRVARGKGNPVDTSPARALARISVIEAAVVVAMVLAATAMARGLGYRAT
jgi:putative membrane protein